MALIELGVAGGVAVVATPAAGWVATRLGVVDRPGPLKVQRAAVPYLGGAAVAVALAAGGGRVAGWWLLAPILIGAVGLVDDIRPLSPLLRLLGEGATGALAGVVVGRGSIPAAVAGALIMIVLTNTVNLLDGLDGVAASTTAVSVLGLAALGGDRVREVGMALVGSLLGFLVYNRPPARIYLGDAGSYLIGGVLTTLILGNWADSLSSTSDLVVLPLVVAVPLADTATAVVRRWRAGRPLWEGDRSHIYDQLVARGLSVSAAAAVCASVQGLAVIGAYMAASAAVAIAVGVETILFGLLAAVLIIWGFTGPRSREVTV